MTYKSTVIKEASTFVPTEEQRAKAAELGANLDTNLLVTTALPDATVQYLREWPTIESANAWVAWSLTHPGVISGSVEEVV
jgi:hypothetical protein